MISLLITKNNEKSFRLKPVLLGNKSQKDSTPTKTQDFLTTEPAKKIYGKTLHRIRLSYTSAI